MEHKASQKKSALVLPGGGARGAFQVGVLKAIAELVPRGTVNPFGIISGTSAGAVNSAVIASKARRFRVAIAELEHVWANFHCHHVYRTDNLTVLAFLQVHDGSPNSSTVVLSWSTRKVT